MTFFDSIISGYCGDNESTFQPESHGISSYTACFIDTIILGISNLVAIIFMIIRWRTLKRARTKQYHIIGFFKFYQWSAFIATLMCFLVQILQFGAILESNSINNVSYSSSIAPYEYLGCILPIITWFLIYMILFRELYKFTWDGIWMTKFSLCLVGAADVGRFIYIVRTGTSSDSLFYWLFIIYAALNLYLIIFALSHFPLKSSLTINDSYELLLDDEDENESVTGEGKNVCPEYNANLFSRLTFTWISSFMRTGYQRPLHESDLWKLGGSDKTIELTNEFRKHWQKELENKEKASLFRALRKTIGQLYYAAIPYKLIVDASQFVSPFAIDLILDSSRSDQSKWIGYGYSFAMLVGLVIGTISDGQHFQLVMRGGFRTRSVITTEVQRKALMLTPVSKSKFTSGQIFNMVATDAESLQLISQNLLILMSAPIRIIGAMVMLYYQLGISALIALGFLIITLPVQGIVVRMTAKLVRRALLNTDERAKVETEMVEGIEVVKCNAWEDYFWERIIKTRNEELSTLWKSFILGAINVFFIYSIPVLVALATFGTYIALGNVLDANTAFVSLTLLNIVRTPLFQLPMLITQLTQVTVALSRLRSFLIADEQDFRKEFPAAKSGGLAIELKGSFSWTEKKNDQPFLNGIELEVPSGELVAVVGSTGSGKTSLIEAILGLIHQVKGPDPIVRGKVALVPQTAYIINATVRENILFGNVYDEERYNEAIRASSLERDIEAFPGGDMTELGERGINISGGQKQRISIARAVYSNADVILLDDPLSALDAKVGRKVFNQCMLGALKEKTVVLVTNQLHFVPEAKYVVFMNEGKIQEQGTYDDLIKLNGSFSQMMAETQLEENSNQNEEFYQKQIDDKRKVRKSDSQLSHIEEEKKETKLITSEKRSYGFVSLETLGYYMKSTGGYIGFSLLIMQYLSTEAFRVLSSLWLSYWTDNVGLHSQAYFMWFYSLFSFLYCAGTLILQLDLKHKSKTASDRIHSKMLSEILMAPMSFFHTTPLGRIINRLTKDTSDIDRTVADNASFFFTCFLQLFSTFVLIGIITPLVLPFVVPIVLLFYFLYLYFQASVREIKRIDSITRSPIYSSLNDALNGFSTIRAYSIEKRLVQKHQEYVDDNIILTLANNSMNRWLSIRLETLGSLAAFITAILTIQQGSSSATMGLTLSYSLSVTVLTSATVRLASMAEISFNAVERVKEYSELEKEGKNGNGDDDDDDPPDSWPESGSINFDQVKMRYRPGLPLVLKGLTVEIAANEKVGIIGRTGAGKSSLINSLFRLVELNHGKIQIDGIDISKVGLKFMRQRMAIIPQVPVLFTGTIRTNLDPYYQRNDEDLWEALNRAHLYDTVKASELGLEMVIFEGGAPLSAGQKQLLALARALVKNSKILILDEATANVDIETDALVQSVIRTEFANCTVIAIAHRLHTVIDGDKVMVLDKGYLKQYDTPANLLTEEGIFKSMVKETGEASETLLKSIAFGEVDIVKLRAAEAELASKKLARERRLTAESLSKSLLDKASFALDKVHQVRGQLIEKQRERENRLSFDMNETPPVLSFDENLLNALESAYGIISDVESLAHETNDVLMNRSANINIRQEPSGRKNMSMERNLSFY